MSITKKILSNTFWQIAGKFVTATLGIVSIKIVTNYFNTDLYGQYATLFDYISFFAIAADFGLYTIGVREMAKKEKEVSFILGNILSLRLILITIMLSLGGLIAQFIPRYEGTLIPEGIWLVALITSLFLINGTLTTVLQYRLKMLAANLSLIIGKTLSVAYIVLTVLYLHPSEPLVGFHHILYGAIGGNIVMILLTIYFVSKHSPVRLRFDKAYIKEIATQSAPYGISLVLSTIYFRVDVILLGLIRNLTEAGIYGVPLKIMEILSVIPVFFMNTLLPTLTEYVREHTDRARKTIQNAFQFLLMAAVPLLIGGFILAFPMTFAISNPQFLSGYHCENDSRVVYQEVLEAEANCPNVELSPTFQLDQNLLTDGLTYSKLIGSDVAFKIIIFAIFFSYLNTLFTFSLVTLNQQMKLLYINGVGVTFNIISNILLIPHIGFRGAALTTVLSEIIILTGTFYYYRKYLPFKVDWPTTFKTFFAGGLMGLSIYLLQAPTYQYLQNWNIIVLIPLGILIYGAVILGSKAMTLNKLRNLLSPQ